MTNESKPTPELIAQALAEGGSIRKAAELLGWGESTLRKWASQDQAIAAVLYGDERPEPDLRHAVASKDAEVRALRREVRSLSELLGRREEWLSEMVDAARVPVAVPSFRPARPTGSLPERSVVLPIYDIQFGQLVHPTDVPFGKGGYSEEVFDERLAAYVERVSALLVDRAASATFTELWFALGGDLVEGDQIYRGMAWQLQLDPVRQVLRLRRKLSSAIREIIRVAKEKLNGDIKIGVVAVPGNHGKVGGKAAGATPTPYSWDFLCAELVMDDLRAEPVDLMVNEPAGALIFETLGHTFLTVHGDEIQGALGIPFYGFARLDGKAIRLSEVVFDYGLSGHIHQPASIPNGSGGEWNAQPDWVGGNNLSKHIVAASRPGQKVLIVGAKQGICAEERIYFDDRRERHQAPIHRLALPLGVAA